FFQAEDGIRYLIVTGVQTCALPILAGCRLICSASAICLNFSISQLNFSKQAAPANSNPPLARLLCGGPRLLLAMGGDGTFQALEIGRASCREGEEKRVVSGAWG